MELNLPNGWDRRADLLMQALLVRNEELLRGRAEIGKTQEVPCQRQQSPFQFGRETVFSRIGTEQW